MDVRSTIYRVTVGTLLVGVVALGMPGLCWGQARPDPLYIGPYPSPKGLRAGRLEIYPRVEVEEVYDDNIFLDADDEQHDFITHYRPDVHARWALGDHVVEVGANADIADYSDNERENFTNHTFDGAIFLNFARVTVAAMEYFTDTTEPSSSAAQSELAPRTRHEDNETVGVVGLKFGEKARIEFDARYFDTDYKRPDLKRLELNEIGGGTSFFWRVAPKTDIFAGYEFTEVIFDDLDKIDPQDDSLNHVWLAGLSFEPGAKLVGRVSGGAQFRDFESLEDRTIPAFATALTWFATPKFTLAVHFSREFEDSSSSSADEFIRATKMRASMAYNLTDRLAVRLEGEYDLDDYNTDREEESGRGVAEIGYFIVRDLV
ncbi:MAG: outer membrane beta-barrel protein, partial [Nitrospinota bacterium]